MTVGSWSWHDGGFASISKISSLYYAVQQTHTEHRLRTKCYSKYCFCKQALTFSVWLNFRFSGFRLIVENVSSEHHGKKSVISPAGWVLFSIIRLFCFHYDANLLRELCEPVGSSPKFKSDSIGKLEPKLNFIVNFLGTNAEIQAFALYLFHDLIVGFWIESRSAQL